jgi:hypothetical protein
VPVLKSELFITAKDIRELKKQIESVEPGLRAKFVQRIRAIGKEAESPIKSALRRVEPLSGMKNHYGATSWTNGSKPSDSTSVRARAKSGGRSLTTSLVSVRLNSAAASIADMAGRSGSYVGQGKRRSGMTPVVRRTAGGDLVAYARRTPVEAGRKFIANLSGIAGIVKRAASRIAWPAVEKDLPQFEKKIDEIISEYYREANRKSN